MREAQRFFSDKAEAYRTSASHASKDELTRMIGWLAPRPGERALDVATGGGHTAMALAQAGCETIATDATPAMVRDHPPLPRLVCDAERLPFRRSSFDVVASRIAPHHFSDIGLFAQEAARVLRTDGRLYVFDLTTPEDPGAARVIDHVERLRDPSHAHSWSASEWAGALVRAGLEIVRLDRTTSELDLEPWIQRARMPPAREEELRRILRETPPDKLEGYGITPAGTLRVLRVEVLARASVTRA